MARTLQPLAFTPHRPQESGRLRPMDRVRFERSFYGDCGVFGANAEGDAHDNERDRAARAFQLEP